MRLPRGDECLTGNAPHRVLRKNRIEYAVRNLVSEFVGMTFGHRLGREQHFFH